MEINRAAHLGFCFGVKRAIDIALLTAKKTSDIYIIGDIVHNERVIQDIARAGVHTVKDIKDVPRHAHLIIKAHGLPKKIYTTAYEKNIKIIDATCPKVKDIHRKAEELEQKGYQVIVIGDKKHDEVAGILGNIKKGIVIENSKDAVNLKVHLTPKIAVVCQSTQDIENVAGIIKELVNSSRELVFFNTICEETKKRQNEVKFLAKKYDSVLVIGSKKSANTTRLYDIARKINQNTFFIHTEKNINPEWGKFKSTALIGGASTPLEFIKKIEENLEKITKEQK